MATIFNEQPVQVVVERRLQLFGTLRRCQYRTWKSGYKILAFLWYPVYRWQLCFVFDIQLLIILHLCSVLSGRCLPIYSQLPAQPWTLIPVVVTLLLEQFRCPAVIARVPNSTRLGSATMVVWLVELIVFVGVTMIHSGPCKGAPCRCGTCTPEKTMEISLALTKKEEKSANNQLHLVSLTVLKIVWPPWDVQIGQ